MNFWALVEQEFIYDKPNEQCSALKNNDNDDDDDDDDDDDG